MNFDDKLGKDYRMKRPTWTFGILSTDFLLKMETLRGIHFLDSGEVI